MNKYIDVDENSVIMHEIGHFIMFSLYLSTKRGFSKDMFLDSIDELSIVCNKEENTAGHITIDDDRMFENSLCYSFVILGGVLFDILLVEHNIKYRLDKLDDIVNNYINIYCDNMGGSDLIRLSSKKDMYYISSSILELKNIICELWNNETIRKIIKLLHENLQSDKCINGDKCYSIIESYIPELKQLGKKIYCPKMRLKIKLGYAKALLF